MSCAWSLAHPLDLLQSNNRQLLPSCLQELTSGPFLHAYWMKSSSGSMLAKEVASGRGVRGKHMSQPTKQPESQPDQEGARLQLWDAMSHRCTEVIGD
jgi:hypothetical protein